MPQRNIQESVIYLGSSFGTGYAMETASENMNQNNTLLTGLGVGVLSFAGSMFVENDLAENALDGIAAGSISFVGSQMREGNFLRGVLGGGQQQTAASGSPRVVRVSRSRGSNNSGGNSSSRNVVEM